MVLLDGGDELGGKGRDYGIGCGILMSRYLRKTTGYVGGGIGTFPGSVPR